jgi:3-hydroxybutyrate dehydrogenase
MELDLRSRRALVTGAGSGIGLGIARTLAAEGARLAIVARNRARLDEAAAGIERIGGVRPLVISCDLATADGVAEVIGAVTREWGGVDILVNNAGIQHVAPVEEFPTERWDAIIAINLSSAFHTIAAAVPHMKAAGYGRIINIASAHGLRASPFKAAYVAAKHGVVGLTKTVALELAGKGVTCNAVCPGFVLTPLVETQIEDRAKETGLDRETVIRDIILEKQPSKEFATVEEIAAATVFLASREAAQITGTTLSVDGGWTAQ